MKKAILALKSIGVLEYMNYTYNHKYGVEHLVYCVSGERKISDVETIRILGEIQKEHFSDFPILYTMDMESDTLLVHLKSK